MGSREGASVRMNTQQLENFSRGRGGLQEMGSREGEHLQGELQLGKRWAPGRGLHRGRGGRGRRAPQSTRSRGEDAGHRVVSLGPVDLGVQVHTLGTKTGSLKGIIRCKCA